MTDNTTEWEKETMIDGIRSLLEAPPTDDPLDAIAEIAALVGIEDYAYFNERGRWVLYPNHAEA